MQRALLESISYGALRDSQHRGNLFRRFPIILMSESEMPHSLCPHVNSATSEQHRIKDMNRFFRLDGRPLFTSGRPDIGGGNFERLW